eukprot:232548_1
MSTMNGRHTLKYIHDIVEIWSDYIAQSTPNKSISDQLDRIANQYQPIAVNTKHRCIHQQCIDIESCVDRIISMMTDPLHTISETSLSNKFFKEKPAAKKLCNHYLLLLMQKTNKCETIMQYFYKYYCPA